MPDIMGKAFVLSLAMLLTANQVGMAQGVEKARGVDYRTDESTGAQYWDAELWGRSARDGQGTGMTARKHLSADGRISYLLILDRQERDWAFFRGPSHWLIDGERVTVGTERDGTESAKNDVTSRQIDGAWVYETAYYTNVSPGFFQALASAQEVEMRLLGDQDSYTKKLGMKELERARRFYETVVAPGEQTSSSKGPPLPHGTKFVADAAAKTYVAVNCQREVARIRPEDRHYYQTEAAAEADGYDSSKHC